MGAGEVYTLMAFCEPDAYGTINRFSLSCYYEWFIKFFIVALSLLHLSGFNRGCLKLYCFSSEQGLSSNMHMSFEHSYLAWIFVTRGLSVYSYKSMFYPGYN
jgi:hypothetical protein